MRVYFSIIWLLMLAACGPQYETHYSYTPPQNYPESRQCLQSCEFQKQQCTLLADNSYQLCQAEARNEEYQCEADARYYYQRCINRNRDHPEQCSVQRPFCPSQTCWRDDRRCDELYRSCYATCGGSVRSETVCTSNCDAQPQPAPANPAPVTSP